MSWRKRKFTFVLIPDANSRIRRLRVPRMVFYLIPMALLLTALSVFLWLYITKMNYDHSTDALNLLLHKQKEQFEKTASSKDQTIENLQHEVIDLTEQAKEIRDKLEELKKLEDELKTLAKIKVTTTNPIENHAFRSSGVGGEPMAVTEDNLHDIAAETKLSLQAIDSDIAEISEKFSSIKEILEQKSYMERITPSIWPVDSRKITSGFGIRSDPFTRRPSFHGGIDINGDLNDPVYAAADGVVRFTGWDGVHGNNITLDHSNGIITIYMHLNKILVGKADKVKKGQTIGLMGSTGRSTGNHLHYEVLHRGIQIDPRPYLQKKGS